MNPTQAVVEERVAALEGGVARPARRRAARPPRRSRSSTSPRPATTSCRARRSTAARTTSSTTRCPKLGIEVTFVENPDDLEQWRAAVRPNTKLFFAETIANPKNDILDIEGVAEVAHEDGVPLIVDNTVATPYLIRPFECGADIVVHSATKYLGGHGTVDRAASSSTAARSTSPPTPSASRTTTSPTRATTALVYARDLGVGSALGANLAYILKARVQLLRDLGSAISPFNAFLIAQGIETLSLRIERHVAERPGGRRVARGARRGRSR